jgi:two-component system, NtrC family, response regulator HupR/HoxA
LNAPLLRQESTLPHHASRIPLYVPARAKPKLRDCWVVNLSATGMAMIGGVDDGAAPPKAGDVLEAEFTLPRSSEALTVRGKVAWSDVVTNAERAPLVWLGLAFDGIGPTTQTLLAQHIAAYRPKVVTVFASDDEARRCEALENDFTLQHAATQDELRAMMSRGDVSVVVVFGSHAEHALAAVEEVAGGARRWTLEHRPAVIFCAAGAAEDLLRLHNEGKLFESIDRPLEISLLASALQEAAQDHEVRSELRRASLKLERAMLERPAPKKPSTPEAARDQTGIVFVSDAMQKVMNLVRIIAPQRLPVLLLGETGTGKELVSRAIHGLSDRSKEAFVVQDCGVLAETLLESELFGHAKGAFTGAVAEHPGLFRVADGGTIVLDEIENTTPALQAKLLRVIESGEVRPVGGTRSMVVDVRIVAASNRNLRAEVEAGRFRADLFYRLSPFPIELPPLRERRDDVMPIATELLKRATASLGRRVPGFTPEAEALLLAYEWRGNVRELRNIVERAVLLAPPGKRIRPVDLPEALCRSMGTVTGDGSGGGSLKHRVTAYEREVIREALERNGGVLRRTAAELQTNAMTLGRRAKQLGLWPHRGGSS